MTILGVAKLLGVIALLSSWPSVVERMGVTQDSLLTCLDAAASHAFVGDPVMETLLPLIILGIAAVSNFLRPTSRRLVLAETKLKQDT